MCVLEWSFANTVRIRLSNFRFSTRTVISGEGIQKQKEGFIRVVPSTVRVTGEQIERVM